MAELSLLPHVLGDVYELLPGALRAVHDSKDTVLLAGRAKVERRRGFLAWAICAVTGLPEAGQDVVVTVEFTRHGLRETWKRRFGGRSYQSTLHPAGDRPSALIERFGPFELTFALSVESDRLILELRQSRFLGIPLPRAISPRCSAEEREEDGRFVFDIPLDLPGIGRILRYQGWLIIVEGKWGE